MFYNFSLLGQQSYLRKSDFIIFYVVISKKLSYKSHQRDGDKAPKF